MTALPSNLRPARPEDAEALAELINYAGEGLPIYLWERMAESGETVWDVGRRRARREEGAFSAPFIALAPNYEGLPKGLREKRSYAHVHPSMRLSKKYPSLLLTKSAKSP